MPDPITEFFAAAERARAQSIDTSPVAIATAGRDGKSSLRIVLIREVDDRGFVFYTNYDSRKARELTENPVAALCFFWPAIEQQIRVEGPVEKVTGAESDAYFATRPRGSQLGAWASDQSGVLASREELEQRFHDVEARFKDKVVTRPPNWGGYRLVPERIEFWYGRPDRLHDRIAYTREGGGWRTARLYP